MSINLKPDEVKLHPSFASIFNLTDDTTGHFVGAFALTAIGTAHSAGVKGYAFCQEAPDFITCPSSSTARQTSTSSSAPSRFLEPRRTSSACPRTSSRISLARLPTCQ